MGKINLGVLASGRGSNLQSIIDASERGELDAEVKVPPLTMRLTLSALRWKGFPKEEEKES